MPHDAGTASDPAPAGPLGLTSERFSTSRVLHFQVGPPTGPQWYPVPHIAESPRLDGWLHELSGPSHGRRAVAAASFINRLASRVVKPAFAAFAIDRRTPLATPDEVVLHRDADALFDAMALATPSVAVLPGDPAAAHPAAVVLPGESALADALTAFVVEAMAPVVRAVGARAPLRQTALWGSVADAVANSSVLAARLFHRPAAEVWGQVDAVVDRLAARVPLIRARPRLFPVRWSGGDAHVMVRGTCCLKYHEYRAAGGVPDRRYGAGYCGTCPLRDDAERLRQRREKLEREAAQARGVP